MTRRVLALAAATLTITGGLAFGALWRYALHLDERDAADELAVLRDLSRGARIDLAADRICSALIRLRQRGYAVRIEGSYYLTRAGWARVGKPLSDRDMDVLAYFARPNGSANFRQLEAEFEARHEIAFANAEGRVDRMGLLGEDGGLTPAGRAVLGEVSP